MTAAYAGQEVCNAVEGRGVLQAALVANCHSRKFGLNSVSIPASLTGGCLLGPSLGVCVMNDTGICSRHDDTRTVDVCGRRACVFVSGVRIFLLLGFSIKSNKVWTPTRKEARRTRGGRAAAKSLFTTTSPQ